VVTDFPEVFPLPTLAGYGLNHVSPLLRTEMDSGRARVRRVYTETPSLISARWVMSSVLAAHFEAWFRDTLGDGAAWFNLRIRVAAGVESRACRFVEMYDGPELVGRDLWRFSAELETRDRA
jgi:hypothetical protein